MDRRTFLQSVAAAPLVFGIPDLLAQDSDKSPEWFSAATDRMKATGRCGVVLIGPADQEKREEMGELLLALIEGKDADAHAIFAEAVVVCMRRATATRLLGALDEKENGVVLNAAGQRLGAATVTMDALRKSTDFVAAMRFVLHGSDGARLRETVRQLKQSLSEKDRDAAAKAIDEVDVEGEAPAGAVKTLRVMADRTAPWLAYASLDAVYAQGRERLRSQLLSVFDSASREKPGPRLPYGARISGKQDEVDRCPACGMGEAPVRSRRFLDFLAE